MDSSYSTWIFIIVIFGVLYFVSIRPQNQRDKELRNLRKNLAPGDDIITIGGIYGKVVRVKDDENRVVIMSGSDRVKIEVSRDAVAGYANPEAKGPSTKKADKTESAETKESKPSPKSIKKLGAKKEEAPAEEAPAEAEEEAVSDAPAAEAAPEVKTEA